MSLGTIFKAVAKRAIPDPMIIQLRWWQVRWQVARARRLGSAERKPHGLPGSLLVSLTSFPARFGTLHLTLESLLQQTMAPNSILLWIAEEDLPLLPAHIRSLGGSAISIRTCDDIRSYKKLVPALEEYPEAFIVTADDDLFYEPTWLEQLVDGYDPQQPTINARRAHRVRADSKGRVEPYSKWGWEVWDEAARRPSVDIMPTCGAGALYPPHSLHPQVTDRSLFQKLSPTADDLWFYWMARRAGTRCKVVGRKAKTVAWPMPVENSLGAVNTRGGNDRQIRNLEAKFGNPLRMD